MKKTPIRCERDGQLPSRNFREQQQFGTITVSHTRAAAPEEQCIKKILLDTNPGSWDSAGDATLAVALGSFVNWSVGNGFGKRTARHL